MELTCQPKPSVAAAVACEYDPAQWMLAVVDIGIVQVGPNAVRLVLVLNVKLAARRW